MAQLLIALDVLVEDQGSVPSNHTVAHNHLLIPVPGDPTFSLASLGTRHEHGANTYRHADIQMYIHTDKHSQTRVFLKHIYLTLHFTIHRLDYKMCQCNLIMLTLEIVFLFSLPSLVFLKLLGIIAKERTE